MVKKQRSATARLQRRYPVWAPKGEARLTVILQADDRIALWSGGEPMYEAMSAGEVASLLRALTKAAVDSQEGKGDG